MFGEIEPIGFESSKRIGKIIFQTQSIIILLSDDETVISLEARDENEYFYTDYIKNAIHSFTIESHIVKANGTETDVIGTFFLRGENDYILLKEFIDSVNRNRRNMRKKKSVFSPEDKLKSNSTKGWLSKRREV